MVVAISGMLMLGSCASSDEPASPVATTQRTDSVPSPTTQAPVETTQGPQTTSTDNGAAGDDGCANVIDAGIDADGDGKFTVSATVRSADTGWEKYADLWEVRTAGGEVLGERVLTHPHETEQPFTRSLSGVEIPGEVAEVVVIAHDLVAGYCGESFTIAVPHP